MSYIDRAVMDLIARGQSSRLVPSTGKIADITHADTNEHSMALPAGFPENTKALYITAPRTAGTGYFRVYSVSGATSGTDLAFTTQWAIWIRASDGLFYYKLLTANDDFDIYCHGYVAG